MRVAFLERQYPWVSLQAKNNSAINVDTYISQVHFAFQYAG